MKSRFRQIVEKALKEVKVIQPDGYDFEGKIYENPSKSDMYRLESQSKDAGHMLRGILLNNNVYLADAYDFTHLEIILAAIGLTTDDNIPKGLDYTPFFVKNHNIGLHEVDPNTQKWVDWTYENHKKLANSPGIKRLFTDEQLDNPFFTDEY